MQKKNSGPKILMYEPTGAGGLALYTKNLCNALAKKDCLVHLLTSSPYEFVAGNRPLFSFNDVLLKMRTDAFYLRWRLFWAIDRIGRFWLNARIRDKYVSALQPDIIHVQICAPIIDIFYLPRLATKYKLVYTVHDVFPHKKRISFSDVILRKLYKSVDHLIVHTLSNRKQLTDFFGIDDNRITIIPHGVHTPHENLPTKVISRKTLGLPNEKFILLFFGSLRDNKGLDILLKSFAKVIESHKNVVLLIAGNPPFGNSFEEYRYSIARLHINNNTICHLGFVPEEKVPYYYRASDVIIMPYKHFGSQSGVLLQAYYYQRPVIVTDVGGLGELVKEDNVGVVIPPASHEKLSHAIITMIESKKNFLQYELNMARAVREKYNWDIIAKKTLEFYSDL